MGYLLKYGSAVAANAVGVSLALAPRQTVVSWEGDAVPCEVALLCEPTSPSNLLFPLGSSGAFVGSMNPDYRLNARDAGFFLLEYGIGLIKRTRTVDMRSARLFLGVCDYVRVIAVRYGEGSQAWPGGGSPVDFNVAASVGVAVGGSYDELTCTVEALVLATATLAETPVIVPAGTYAAECSVSTTPYGGEDVWGSTNPSVLFQSDLEQQLWKVATNVIIPPFRRIKVDRNFYVSSLAAAVDDMVLVIRFFLNS